MARCFCCHNQVTCYSDQGLMVCKQHKASKVTAYCPICREQMTIHKGKFGSYFECEICGKNWSSDQMRRYLDVDD